MREYFETELQLLREESQEFAAAFPEQARMLNLAAIKDRDPYVERLLEGVAYLTAQVRRRIDDDIPQVCESLLGQIWPHFLRPLPAMTILQFAPRPGQLQQSQTLDQGTMVLSRAVGEDRVPCRFRSSCAVELQPLQINKVELAEVSPGQTRLAIGLQLDAGLLADSLDLSTLKLYLHAGQATAVELHQALTRDVKELRITFPDNPEATATLLPGQKALQPCHLGLDEMLTPLSGRSFFGFHLLHEYFGFLEKYLFVAIDSLEKVAWPEYCHSFEIEIQLNHTFGKEFKLQRDNLRLHCAPAVNLFHLDSEPLSIDHRREEYRLVADGGAPEGIQVYSVDEVVGLEKKSGERRQYRPMNSAAGQTGEDRFFQVVSRNYGAGPANYLSVGGDLRFTPETLSCAITASNGDYPRQFLVENTIQGETATIPSYVQPTNLARPSRQLRPPANDDFRLALISHLSLNYSSLSSAEALKRLLSLYDWTEQEQNRLRIEGISEVKVKPVDMIRQGTLTRGIRVELTIKEENFFSRADIHLFGLVLHEFLGMYATINSFVETRITCFPSNKEFTWQPKFGENFPI
ncbi:MAG: type VI secretion system baseplate subunit TssF [Thermodesulfobacteriota bacterium]